MENKYYLAVETKPKNYFPINLLDLSISRKYHTFKIEELDAFTLKYTKEELLKAIKEENLLKIDNDMNLVVIYYEKNVVRKAEVLTKDYNYDMWQNIKDNYANKMYINKIYNFLGNKIDQEILAKIKNTSDVNSFITIISNLPYLIQRKLYFYLYEK